MARLPAPPAEPPPISTLDGLAPKFRAQIEGLDADLRARGWRPVHRETLRTDERAAWLFGFGRTWDDDRGVVTQAPNALKTWHHFGLAVDYGDARHEPGSEPAAFWRELEECATGRGLVSGSGWRRPDDPHVQWGPPMRVTPSEEAARLLAEQGVEAVWRAVEAA